METNHTPEPWGVSVALSGSENDRGFDIFGDYKHIARVSPMIKDSRGNASHEGKANADRIVACVNALAGLNPDGVRDVVEAFKSLLEYEGLVVEYMGALGNVDAEQKTRKQFTAALAALDKLESGANDRR